MAELKTITISEKDFNDDAQKPKPKLDADDIKFKQLADKHLEKALPKLVSVYNVGKAKDFSAKQANLAKYATYGSETYGKLGFDPYKAGGIPGKKSGMDVLYDDNTHWSADIGRAWDGMWKLAGIGFQDTIGLGAFADSGNYLDFEDTMSKFSSSRAGNAGFWSNTMLSSGYTIGIIGGIAAEELALAGLTAITAGTAAPATIAAGGSLLVQGVSRIKQAGNMLKFVNKLQDVKTATGFMGKAGASVKGFGKALNPLENTMDFIFTADKLKDINGFKQTALGVGSIVRDARKITMSHSESKLEADMAAKEFREKMYDDYYLSNPGMAGKPLPKEMANKIEGESQKVRDNVYTSNFALIYATNAITFDNMLKSMRGTNKFFANAGDLFKVVKKEGGKVAVDVLKKNVWNYGRKKIGQITWQGALKSVVSGSMEGFQELGQDVISESVKAYRERNVKGLQVRGGMMSFLENDVTKAIDKQKSGEGLSTFLSGALMGVFASPVGFASQQTQNYLFNGGVNKSYQYFADRDKYKQQKVDVESKRKEKAKVLTEFFNNSKNFVDAWSKGIYSQSELQEQILTAGESGDQKTMKNKQHESFVNGVHTLLESGMENQFADHLEYMGKNLNAQQLNEIFSRTDITEETKGQYQKKLQHQAENIKKLRGVYNEIQNTINNPIDLKSLDVNDPEYLNKYFKYRSVENLKKELLFSHAKIADRANRQKEIRAEINSDNPLSTLEVNALLDEGDLNQQIQLLKTEVETNSKLSAYGDVAVQNQAQARAKLKAYENYQVKLNAYKAEQKNENGSISESDTFDELFDAYHGILEVSGKNKLINATSQLQFNRQQFNKVFDYLALAEEGRFNQELIDTILNPAGSSVFIEGQEEMLKRLEENKEDHILSALYEFDKKAVSDDMLNDLYNNNLFFDLQELDELLNKGLMPQEIFNIATNELATPEEYEAAQKIINSYIKKLKGKTITNDRTQLNKQGRKLKSDKRTIAGILRQYKVKLNEPIKLSSPEGQRLLAKLMAAENKYLTKLDREILTKLGEQDVTIKFVSDNTLPVKLTDDGILELDIRFAGSDYTNSVMSFENLIVTGLTQHAITEKLKTKDDLYLAARNAMEQAKKAFASANPRANVDELSVFEDVNIFMTEAMNDLQFQKFLATVEDTVQPTSKSLWSTLSTGIGVIVQEDIDKKLANRVINIAAKALDDSIIDNISESNEESKEVKQQRAAASKEQVEELNKLATELGQRWNVNVKVLASQEEADKILNSLQDPFYQKFSTILNDLLYDPLYMGFNLQKGVNEVSLKELLVSIYEKSANLSELIANLKELAVYQTNGKVGEMVDWLVNNADNIGDGIEMVKNIFFQADEETIAGFYDEKTNTAYIVADAVKENTLYHEIFLHPFLINLEKTNPEFYKQLVAEAKGNQEIIDYVEKNYGTEDKIGSRQFEHELVGRAYDLSVSNKLSEKKEPGLFKKMGQFIKRMLAKVAEFLNISKSDIGRFNPRKTTITDLAEYSVNSNAKVNLGKIIEAGKQAQSTEATLKPRTRKKTVKSVRTVIEEQTVNKGGDLLVLDNAGDRPDIFGDFLHPEIVFGNNLVIAEWTERLVDLGQELDDARITNWVYGNIRAQIDGRLVIDVTAEIPVFVKKALQNKKANPRVTELQKEIADLDAKIQQLSNQKKTTASAPAPVSAPVAKDQTFEVHVGGIERGYTEASESKDKGVGDIRGLIGQQSAKQGILITKGATNSATENDRFVVLYSKVDANGNRLAEGTSNGQPGRDGWVTTSVKISENATQEEIDNATRAARTKMNAILPNITDGKFVLSAVDTSLNVSVKARPSAAAQDDSTAALKEFENARDVLSFSKKKFPGKNMPLYQYLRMLNNVKPVVGQFAYYINRNNTSDPVVEKLGTITSFNNNSFTFTDASGKSVTRTLDLKTIEYSNPYFLFSENEVENEVSYDAVEKLINDKKTQSLSQPGGSEVDLKLNVESTTKNGNERIISDDASIKMGDETQELNKLKRYGKTNYYINNGVLGVIIEGRDMFGRSGGSTKVNVKVPEGFNETVFEKLVADIKYPGNTTVAETERVLAEIKDAIQKSIGQSSQDTTKIDAEIADVLKQRNALQDQLNEEDDDIVEEGEETVQQGTKKVKFLMYKSIGKGSTAASAGEWVPLLAIGKAIDEDNKEIEWFVKAFHKGEDPKFNKYGSVTFADIDRDLKVQEANLFTEPENWVTEQISRDIEEETVVEEEIPVEEQEPENEIQAEASYQSRTEILDDLDSVKNEIAKLEVEYDKVTEEINTGKLSLIQKRKAINKQNLLAIDINDLYQQLNNLQAGLSEIGEEAEILNNDAQYVPAFDYNGNEIISSETPWMDIPQSLRNELADLFGKALNKLNDADVIAIKTEMKSNPKYISIISAFSQLRLDQQNTDLAVNELKLNNQKVEDAKLKLKQQQQQNKIAARQAKKQKRASRPKVSDEDILKSVLKDYDYSILSPKEISQLVAKLKDKSNALIDFTVNDIVAFINNKKLVQAQKEQKLADIEQQKEEARINKQIKGNLDFLMLPVIPFKTNYGKEIKMRIPQNGMVKFITTYHPEIFTLPRQEFLDAVNDILKSRITDIKFFNTKDFGFERGSKTTHLKLYSLFRKLEKEKKLYPEVVNKINLALYNADSKFRIRATRSGKNATMSSMYVIQKVKSTKRITPPGAYGSSKKILGSYEVNTGSPSEFDLEIAIAMYFLQGGKIKPSALEQVFGENASEVKDWKGVSSESAADSKTSFDSASVSILESQNFDVTTTGIDGAMAANALEAFLMKYSSLSNAVRNLVDQVQSDQSKAEDQNRGISNEEADERLFLQELEEKGMSADEAAEYLAHLKFLQTEEGQEALESEAKVLDEYYNSQEFELLNDEFAGDENDLSDAGSELKDVGSEEEEVEDVEEETDTESIFENKDTEKLEKTEVDLYLDELDSLASIPTRGALPNAIEYAWDNLNKDKKTDIAFAAAVFRLVTNGKFAFGEKTENRNEAIIRAKISDGHYRGKSVQIDGKVYRIAGYQKRMVVLQDVNNLSEYLNFEIDAFLNGIEKEVPVNTDVKNLNIDSIVKVKEFDYIKSAYTDILNNFTTYMGEANSLSEDKLISSLKEETTKCKT